MSLNEKIAWARGVGGQSALRYGVDCPRERSCGPAATRNKHLTLDREGRRLVDMSNEQQARPVTPKCVCGHSIMLHTEIKSEGHRPCLAVEDYASPCGCDTFQHAALIRGAR